MNILLINLSTAISRHTDTPYPCGGFLSYSRKPPYAIHNIGSKKRQYDPIDYECIDKVEFWVIDENANEKLDYEELEEMLDEELAKGNKLIGVYIYIFIISCFIVFIALYCLIFI